MQTDHRTRVVGVYAYSRPGKVLRYEDACVVTGSAQAIDHYLGAVDAPEAGSLRTCKLRFGELLDGLNQGGAYAFSSIQGCGGA